MDDLSIAPISEPITLAEAKAQLRLYSDHEDAIIEGYISAARDYCERFTGVYLAPRPAVAVVPQPSARQAMLVMLTAFFEQRDGAELEASKSAAECLLRAHRVNMGMA